MLFTFAGSSHSKYTTYLLQFITNLELESSQPLRETTLNSMLVNLSGRAGGFTTGDLIQEFFNRLLEAIIERKGADFGDIFIRQIVSRNLHHMGWVKTELRDGLGLAARAGRHSDPHMKPEVKTLLRQYARHELHSRRSGRSMDEGDVDDFQRGWEKLAKGKLRKWVVETVQSRGLKDTLCPSGNDSNRECDASDDEGDEEDSDTENVGVGGDAPTFGSMSMVDGEFIIESVDFEETLHDYLALLEAEKEEGSASELSTDEDVDD